jgi:GST-like protein
MNQPPDYTPPRIWTAPAENGGRFASINRPVAGATHDKALPVGRHPLQLYSLATPNGVKVTVMLEELLASATPARVRRLADPHQRGRSVRQRLRRRQPQLQDPGAGGPQRPAPVRVFESGAILLYLAEKFGAFLPTEPPARAECLSWLFWQMGSAPYLGGGFGHFYAYAPTRSNTPSTASRWRSSGSWTCWTAAWPKRRYLAGDEYTVADIAVWPWYGALAKGQLYEAGEFLQVQDYTHVRALGRRRSPSARRQRGRRSTAPGARRRASCPSATTPVTSTRLRPHHDHPVRLRHRTQPAPSAHPAGREGHAHETVQVDLRSGEQLGEAYRRVNPQCTVPALLHRRRPGADRQRRHRRLGRGALPEPPLLGRTPAEKGRDRQLAVAGGVRGPDGQWPRRCATASPAMAGRALPGPVGYAQIPGTGRARLAKAAAFLRHAGPAAAGA